MKRIWWCSVVVYPPQFLDPFFVAFFVSPANANGKKNIISPSKTPVIKPYGPPPGEDVHDVSLLQFATHVLCQVGSRQPVGMPRRNGQQVTYQSWEETMEWVSICQRSSMNIKIAVPSKRTACDTANIYIYIYIIFKMLKLKCYKVMPQHLRVSKPCTSSRNSACQRAGCCSSWWMANV